MTLAHRHDDLEFNHADVDLEYVIDGRPHLIPAGTVAVFWAARPHRLIGGQGSGIETWLTVPLQLALGWRLPAGFMGRMLRGEVAGTPVGSAIRLDELALRWSAELNGDDLQRRIAETEIEAFALRIAAEVSDITSPDTPSPRAGDGPRAASAAMAAFISENSAADISVEHVSSHVHLNPQYAMSVFRGSLGITIGEYLGQCRVAAAQQLLLTTDLPLPDIGFAAGFRSQSQFYALFTRWCGQAPGAYRRRLRQA
jgi:AraC-like DNA-binding protein